MPKIVQINSVVNSGSTGRIVENLGVLAIERGFDSYIAYGRCMMPSSNNLIRIGDSWDVRVHGMITRLFDNHGFASKNATIQFLKKIDQINPDIIHLHNLHGYYINIEILFNYLAKINKPVVWTLHDCWTFTGHCAYFDFYECNKWKTQCEHCPQTQLYPSSFYDGSKNNFIRKKKIFTVIKKLTIVPVSFWLEVLVRQSFFKSKNIKTIHNGIDTTVFFPVQTNLKQRLGLQDSYIVLGVANIWDDRKGLCDFIELRKQLGTQFEIIIIGLDKKKISQLPPGIIGIERTENISELTEYYSIADVFLNPTYEDNFPTTNLEALACGTPVVTYNTGGSPEAISDQTGLVVNKGNINELLEAVWKVILNGKAYYSESCRRRALNSFKNTNCFQGYITLYGQLLQ